MGLGMIDIYSTHSAAKCSWIRRLFNDRKSKWKTCMRCMLNIDHDMLNKNYGEEVVKNGKTMFHNFFFNYGQNYTGQTPKQKCTY